MTMARDSVADLVIRYLVILVQPLGQSGRVQGELRWTPAFVGQPSAEPSSNFNEPVINFYCDSVDGTNRFLSTGV